MQWVGTPEEIARQYGFFDAETIDPPDDGEASTLGAGLPDFLALEASDPTFASGWDQIAPQLVAEGSTDLTGAKIALADAYTSLISSNFGSIDPNAAIAAAQKYVTIGQTIAGAVGTVSSLIQAGNTGANPTDVFQAFTGTMIGLAVASGVASAGVGAAIVGFVTLTIDVLNGIIGPPKKLYDSTDPACAYGPFNIDKNNPPSFAVGCIAAWGPAYTPDSPYWRPFPALIALGADGLPHPTDDGAWFVRGQVGPGNWRGAFYGCVSPFSDQNNTPDKWWSQPGVNPAGTDQNARPIDNAFPSYASVIEGNGGFGQFDTTGWPADWVATFGSFVAAFQAAWRANAAYALNGLKPQADWSVLVHLLRMWNVSHEGPAYSLRDSAPGYVGQVVTDALAHGIQDEISDGSGHGFKLNMGAIKQAATAATATSSAPTPATSSAPAPASSSSAAPAVVATVATVAAGGLWFALGQPLTLAALKAAVGEAVGAVARAVRL